MIKLIVAKDRLKRAYLSYRRYLDEFSCGPTLALEMSMTLSGMKKDLETAHQACKTLDPSCPDLPQHLFRG